MIIHSLFTFNRKLCVDPSHLEDNWANKTSWGWGVEWKVMEDLNAASMYTQLLSCVWLFCDSIRLLCPWDFPGKNTEVGCHFLLWGISWPRNQTCVSLISCIGRQILYHCVTWEAPWMQTTHLYRCKIHILV